MILFAVALAVGFGMYALWERSRSRQARNQHEWPPYITVADIEIMRKAGLTAREWQELTKQQRADLRWRIR